jgi:hypothetical protein
MDKRKQEDENIQYTNKFAKNSFEAYDCGCGNFARFPDCYDMDNDNYYHTNEIKNHYAARETNKPDEQKESTSGQQEKPLEHTTSIIRYNIFERIIAHPSCDVMTEDSVGNTPIIMMLGINNIEKLKLILKSPNVDFTKTFSDGTTILTQVIKLLNIIEENKHSEQFKRRAIYHYTISEILKSTYETDASNITTLDTFNKMPIMYAMDRDGSFVFNNMLKYVENVKILSELQTYGEKNNLKINTLRVIQKIKKCSNVVN